MRKATFLLIAAIALTGCSALSAVSDILPTGKGVEATAQVGETNVKQAVGVTQKTDTSSKQETSIKDSTVAGVDTSSKKQITTSSITADSIKADKIEISNNEAYGWEVTAGLIAMGFLFGAIVVLLVITRRKKGA